VAAAVLTGVLVPVTPVGIPVLAAALVAVMAARVEQSSDGRPSGPDDLAGAAHRAVGDLLKLAGTSLPTGLLESPLLARIAGLLPVALLAALVTTGTIAHGVTMVVDARLVGPGAAVAALLLRVPFLGVVVAAAAVTALSRLAVG